MGIVVRQQFVCENDASWSIRGLIIIFKEISVYSFWKEGAVNLFFYYIIR